MGSVTQEVDMVLCLEAREILVPIMNDTHLGRWLKSHREEKKLTQMELAYAAGTTPATISRIEKGNQGATEKRVVQIATALGADPREALEALIADTPGLEPVVEIERVVDEELLQDSLMAYTGDNPVLRAARRAALGEQQLVSAEEMQSALDRAKAAGPVGGEGMPPVVVRGNGPVKKRIQKVDK